VAELGGFSVAETAASESREIAGRYQLRGLLGRGGMAVVHRAYDLRTEREIALKQLELSTNTRVRGLLEHLFESEFRTLAQLTHPSAVEVYDYGLDAHGPFYTMEILTGSSLADCAPLPWREACALMHDVCSCLAVLHARRLLHRDLTPHNVRRTADGRAKLIDFGAMVTMGPNHQVVGTAAFMAPEVAHRLTLDARADLFAVGATLYFALTKHVAYPARSLDDLKLAWRSRPAAPSTFVSDIPARLDALVIELLSLEPALRPPTAADVMQKLRAVAGTPPREDFDASNVYLGTPALIGRAPLLEPVRARAQRATRRRGGAWLFDGQPGSGRSRMLDAAAWEAQTEGLRVVQAGCRTIPKAQFSLACTLTEQLVDQLPELCRVRAEAHGLLDILFEPETPETRELRVTRPDPSKPDERASLHDAIAQFWLEIADAEPLAFVIDDVEYADDASIGLLVTLADRAAHHGILLSCSAEDKAVERGLDTLRRRCERAVLAPLTAAETEQLLHSVFGEVAHLSLLTDRIFQVACGNPAASMALLRHLLERKQITYDGGSWRLPAHLDAAELPATLDQALLARIERLSVPARRLAEWHALSTYGVLSLADHAWLCGWAADGAAGPAQSELLEQGILASEGQVFGLINEAWAPALRLALSPNDARERQRALAELGVATSKPLLRCAHHFFEAGLDDRALDILASIIASDVERSAVVRQDMSIFEIGRLFMRGLAAADAAGRDARQRADYRRYVTTLSSVCEEVPFDQVGPQYLTILKRDSGFDDWQALEGVTEPSARLTQALQRAAQRYAETPQNERTFRVDEAIRYLMGYTAVGISISTSRCDARLCRSLPALIEPFAPLSPLIECMLNNCLAAREISVEGRYAQGRARWCNVLERLGDVKGDALRHVDVIRYSIAFALGCVEAAGGYESAERWADHMESLPLPLVDAHYLRRVVRLQQGDFEGAERFRRQAELLTVKSGARPLFASVHALEVAVYTQARDLRALAQVVDSIKLLADRYPGWESYYRCAHGCQELLRGDLLAAKRALESALELCSPALSDGTRSVSAFILTASVYIEVLLELGDALRAREFARRALDECTANQMFTTDPLERGLAVAEAQLGEGARASARLDTLLERQLTAGVTGLTLGATYEARARIAIATRDLASFEKYAQLTAATYKYGRGSPLGARYLRLVTAAQRAGLSPVLEATAYESAVLGVTTLAHSVVDDQIASSMRDAHNAEERAQLSLRFLCEAARARNGQFYLVQRDGTLRWMAAHQAPPAGENELNRARACLAQARDDEAMTTKVLLTEAESPVAVTDAWIGSDRDMRQAFLLTSTLQSAIRHVAVVVLDAPAAETGRKVRELLRALAQYLLQADENVGVTAVD
jgi:hypothetical protein